MNRRNFLSKSAVTLGGTTALFLASKALGDVVPAPTPSPCPPPPAGPAVKNVIGNNHKHELVLSYEEVIKSEPKVYSIKGASGHAHNVDLTEAHFEVLRRVGVVEAESTVDVGHSHKVQITRDVIA